MEAPAAFVELDERDLLDTEALPPITKNNQMCELNRRRLGELQLWIRGRVQ